MQNIEKYKRFYEERGVIVTDEEIMVLLDFFHKITDIALEYRKSEAYKRSLNEKVSEKLQENHPDKENGNTPDLKKNN